MSAPRRRIEVVDYEPLWAERFAVERDRLWAAVREAGVDEEVVAIEHIGSTAVPGHAAKPVIDIMVGLRSWPASDTFVGAIQALAYDYREEANVAGRHYFVDALSGHPRTRQVHAVAHDSWFWREHLRFRDYLRRHPDDAASYAELKRNLARRSPHDIISYTEGKTRFIHGVLARARSEADMGRIPEAATGFDLAAHEYERARPGYPGDAVAYLVDRLGLASHSKVVDVGAGTGKLTRLLVPTGARIIAVEPLEGMRRVFRGMLPDVEIVDGTAEELPLEMGRVDAVVAGQAFHWFDAWAALSEIHRVLLEGGQVGLIWNVRDESADWVARWTQIIEPVSDATARERLSRWRDAVAATDLFTDPETATFPNLHVVPREAVVERVASTSFVAALDHDRRNELLDEFRRMLDTHPETRDRVEIAVPYRAHVHTFSRIP